ncbi:MAG: AAA family ATPase [Syntrophorhabdales bacterium]|jgi:exodeoxyribonuclease V alpha subunit
MHDLIIAEEAEQETEKDHNAHFGQRQSGQDGPDYGIYLRAMAETKATEITGTIKNVTFRNHETGYMVLKLDKNTTLCGVYHDTMASLEGARIRASGEWKKHKAYGLQFIFQELTVLEHELFYFLTRMVKGLGKNLALQLIESMGEEALEQVLDHEPEKLLAVKGIKEKKLEKILATWHRFKDLKALSQFLIPLGGTPALVQRIYKELKDEKDLIAQIEENPYRMTVVKGIGFKTADKIAKAMGIAPAHPFRIRACIEYVLFEYTDSVGNSCIDRPLLFSLLEEELSPEDGSIDPELFQTVLRDMAGEERIVFLENDKLTSSFLYAAEKRICATVSLRGRQLSPPVLDDIEGYIDRKQEEMGIVLSDEQRQAIRTVNRSPGVFLLCGYAGTGKSTVSRALLDLLAIRYPKEKIMCCALSGIAADRIRKLSGYKAQTIYSLVFKQQEKLPYAVLLVDESSMVNTELLFRIITRLADTAILIMVGDTAQLPPIGAGNPFADIIEKQLAPAVTLTRIYRQSEDKVIALFANDIREARVPERYAAEGYGDFRFMDVSIPNYFALKQKVKAKAMKEGDFKKLREENSEKIFTTLCDTAATYKGLLTETFKNRDYAGYLNTLQIITPMKSGPLGTERLNEALQQLLNDGAARPEHCVNLGKTRLAFRDKVVHIQNMNIDCIRPADYRLPDREDHYYTDRIYNGMLGIVVAVNRKEELLDVYYPADRTIAAYSFDEARELVRLAYALTIHKTQGSEYKTVMIPMTLSHFIMLNNKLLYTAVTRAKEKVILVGEDYAFRSACRKKDVTVRDTVLKMLPVPDLAAEAPVWG